MTTIPAAVETALGQWQNIMIPRKRPFERLVSGATQTSPFANSGPAWLLTVA